MSAPGPTPVSPSMPELVDVPPTETPHHHHSKSKDDKAQPEGKRRHHHRHKKADDPSKEQEHHHHKHHKAAKTEPAVVASIPATVESQTPVVAEVPKKIEVLATAQVGSEPPVSAKETMVASPKQESSEEKPKETVVVPALPLTVDSKPQAELTEQKVLEVMQAPLTPTAQTDKNNPAPPQANPVENRKTLSELAKEYVPGARLANGALTYMFKHNIQAANLWVTAAEQMANSVKHRFGVKPVAAAVVEPEKCGVKCKA